MNSYRVTWEINVDAESPEEAARKAQNIQRNLDEWAGVFDVYNEDGKGTRVDLDSRDKRFFW